MNWKEWHDWIVVAVVEVVLRELDNRRWIVQMSELETCTGSYIYRGKGNEIDSCSIVWNVLEYSCLSVAVLAFSCSLSLPLFTYFFSFCWEVKMALDAQKEIRFFRTPFMQESVLLFFQRLFLITWSMKNSELSGWKLETNNWFSLCSLFLTWSFSWPNCLMLCC